MIAITVSMTPQLRGIARTAADCDISPVSFRLFRSNQGQVHLSEIRRYANELRSWYCSPIDWLWTVISAAHNCDPFRKLWDEICPSSTTLLPLPPPPSSALLSPSASPFSKLNARFDSIPRTCGRTSWRAIALHRYESDGWLAHFELAPQRPFSLQPSLESPHPMLASKFSSAFAFHTARPIVLCYK